MSLDLFSLIGESSRQIPGSLADAGAPVNCSELTRDFSARFAEKSLSCSQSPGRVSIGLASHNRLFFFLISSRLPKGIVRLDSPKIGGKTAG